ncbi:endonuclease VII domain-containing protein [Streptomyces mirabilis]|uniref:endonuclease VII domain-containing protein n=1 Tax=Streptomyces mirabilis TaxID=68239 RepID=UPI00368BA4F4
MPKRGELKTTCKNGHDLTAPGARREPRPEQRGAGECKQCILDRMRRRRGSSKTGPASRYKGDEHARLAALAAGLKRCPECGTGKSPDAFNRSARSPDGLHPYCRDCQASKRRAGYYADLEMARLRKRASQFGITLEHLQELIKDQSNGCAICGKQCSTGKALALDHDHETGAFRGLLCANCNRGIGYLQDSPDIARSALAYLEKWKGGHATRDEGVLGSGMS